MTLGEIYDTVEGLRAAYAALAKVREKLKDPERLGAMDLVRCQQNERELAAQIERVRNTKL